MYKPRGKFETNLSIPNPFSCEGLNFCAVWQVAPISQGCNGGSRSFGPQKENQENLEVIAVKVLDNLFLCARNMAEKKLLVQHYQCIHMYSIVSFMFKASASMMILCAV